jgi:hypothetical protein
MTDTMITEQDIKTLKSYDTPLGKIANLAIIFAPIFLFMTCIFNLYLASRIGLNAGYPFPALLVNWIKGVNFNADYSGFFVAALERIGTAMLQLGFAITLTILAYAFYKRKNTDKRILETLNKNNLL